jgi:Family of unknown function (DUF5677)
MSDAEKFIEGTAESFERMMIPRVEITGVESETDVNKIDGLVFELYKEALSVLNLAAHLLDETANAKGGWPRNQAICAGLIVRIAKFMLVVTQLSAKGDRADVVFALNRSILETTVNLEFLLNKNEVGVFDQFVKFSLGPERELYDIIQSNIVKRGGEVLPIEKSMLASIDRVCKASDVKIEEAKQKYGDWGGGVKERLKYLGIEEQYIAVQRLPSHAVHGSWVDLCMRHLTYNSTNNVFGPDNSFANVDARLLGPIAIFVLQPTKIYLERYFSGVPDVKLVLDRIGDLRARIGQADSVHEKLFASQR